MKKKFLSVILCSALMLGTAGMFTSCEDYDDDIANLQAQLDKKASLEDLTAKVSTLQSAVDEAKTAASEAMGKAQEALSKALEALDKAGSTEGNVTEDDLKALEKELQDRINKLAEGGVTEDDLKALEKKLQDQIDKLASLDAVNAVDQKIVALEKELLDQIKKLASLDAVDQKIASLKGELDGLKDSNLITEEKLKELAAEIDNVSAEVMSLIGHRLTSLAVIPTSHVNGIAAITLTTLKYTPQRYQAIQDHNAENPILDHVSVPGKNANYISTDYNEAYFHVSPSVGVGNSDIELPLFDCIESENIMTRAAGEVKTNSPIQPVTYNIDKGVLTVKFKKTVKEPIAPTVTGSKEKFSMASLKVPIKPENYTADEKEAFEENGTKVYVNSEYVRLHEEVKVPYLVNSKTDFSKAINGEFAEETQNDGKEDFYVHYHDSLCVYTSEANELVDVKQPYNEPLDLKKLVKVCVTDVDADSHTDHENLANYKDYGLTFRFYIPQTPYITLGGAEGNTNKTDQQKFAKLDSHENGIMSSVVYTIDGSSATAVGREPIVRVDLVDTVNNALIAMRYMKVKWVKEAGERELSYAFADTIYRCGSYIGKLGAQKMNENIYDKAKDGGMTKQEFHSVYTEFSDGTGEGTASELINSENGVDSYDIRWELTHKDIVKKYPNWNNQEKMVFTKVCYYTDTTGAYPKLKITLTRTIYKPVFKIWGHDGRYWKEDGKYTTFNINPIVYNTKESNPAWGSNAENNPTCNIYTDLLNGFLDNVGVKPTTGLGGAIYYEDIERPGKKFFYSGAYNAAPGAPGEKGAAYSEEGARFVFDKEKIAGYEYDYFDGTSVVKRTAIVSEDGTKLYIKNKAGVDELAAEIINYVDNSLNAGEKTYNIRLQEANPSHEPRSNDAPTEAAKALVGKNVPIKLVADICYDDDCAVAPLLAAAHTVTIKEFDAFIIEPLSVETGKTDNFTDATIGGSTIDVKDAFRYVSWNADEKGEKYVVSNKEDATELQKALWEFYEVVEGEWMMDQIKSNLKLVDGNLVPTAGVKDGPLPSNTKVDYNKDETLTYNNYSGTPVNWDYKLFIPVKFGYKWKTFTLTFEVDVKKNSGTPGQ